MHSKFLTIFALALTLALTGCFKDEEYNTMLYLDNTVQTYSGEDAASLEGVIYYAYAGDAEEWGALSYEDALAGVAYNYENDKQLDIIATSTPEADNAARVGARIKREKVMLLAVDTVNQIFAMRNYTVGLNLDKTYIVLLWRSWKDETYTESYWTYDQSSVILTEEEETEEE